MPGPLSNDLRIRVVESIEDGETYESAAKRFGVGRASVSRWWRRWRETESVSALPTGGSKSPVDETARVALKNLVHLQPDVTLAQLVDLLEKDLGIRTNDSTISRVLAEMGLTRKKKSYIHVRRQAADVISEREAFQAAQPTLNSDDLVWIDEAGVNLSMTPAYGRAMSGERVVEHRPNIRTAKTSLVGAITTEGVVSIGMVAGSYNAVRFLDWLVTDLLPKLPRGKVLIWDNVKFHFNADVLDAVAKAGCTLLKMPPYSPDLNPIEECWSKLKHFIRTAKARTQQSLEAAILTAQARVDKMDAIGWVRHAGYPC